MIRQGNKTPLLSVIVPIYNVEKFLQRSLTAIKNQTYTNFECILVNDGSSDFSKKICESFIQEDSRFKLLNQNNSGVASARNSGLRNAKGEYLIFLDPDDYITRTMFGAMIESLTTYGSEIVLCDAVIEDIDCNVISEFKLQDPEGLLEKETVMSYLATDADLPSWMWNKCYKARLFHSVYFPENLRVLEDFAIQPDLFHRANLISYVKGPYYHYVQHEKSLLHTTSAKDELSMLRIRADRANFYLRNYPKLAHVAIHSLLVNCYLSYYRSWSTKNGRLFLDSLEYRAFIQNCSSLYTSLHCLALQERLLWLILATNLMTLFCILFPSVKFLYKLLKLVKNITNG